MSCKLKVCLVTVAIGEYGKIFGKYAIPLFELYCKLNGFDFKILDNQLKHLTPNWVRFEIFNIMKYEKYDYIIYIDLDFIINPYTPNILDILPKDGWDIAAYNLKPIDKWSTSKSISQIKNYCNSNFNNILHKNYFNQEIIEYPRNYNGNPYINGGFFIISKSSLNWYNNAKIKEVKTGAQDQNALNLAIINNKLKLFPLGEEWNYCHLKDKEILHIFEEKYFIHCSCLIVSARNIKERENIMKKLNFSLNKYIKDNNLDEKT